MPPLAAALPVIAAGTGIYSAIKGAQQQSQANSQNQQQLQQLQQQQQAQNQIRNQVLANLAQQPSGAVGNPFSSSYGPLVSSALGSGPLSAPQPTSPQLSQAVQGLGQAVPNLQRLGQIASAGPGGMRSQYSPIR